MKKNVKGGVTAAKGFVAGGVYAGIKNNNRNDMAMVYSEVPCVTAGTFTTNKVKAAPVKWDYKVVHESAFSQAIVVNTGIANASTGALGYQYCEEMAKAAGEALHIPADSVIVASTGVIGKQLPMDIIKSGIAKLPGLLGPDEDHAKTAAESIMTTDTRPKQIACSFEVDGVTITVGGMCKGAGMIHPNMATMLCFITTDCMIKKDLLQKALSDVVKDTFNMISVDGDTSTNDSCIVMANGLAQNKLIDTEDAAYEQFYQALFYVLRDLSKKIAGDGEGCTKLLEVQVKGAFSDADARMMAKSVACSNLTKCAIYGRDANWGRIICAMGYSGGEFDPDKVDISFTSEYGTVQVCENGSPLDFSEEAATKILSSEHVIAICDCKQGPFEATAYGCDLTHEYVNINADYRS